MSRFSVILIIILIITLAIYYHLFFANKKHKGGRELLFTHNNAEKGIPTDSNISARSLWVYYPIEMCIINKTDNIKNEEEFVHKCKDKRFFNFADKIAAKLDQYVNSIPTTINLHDPMEYYLRTYREEFIFKLLPNKNTFRLIVDLYNIYPADMPLIKYINLLYPVSLKTLFLRGYIKYDIGSNYPNIAVNKRIFLSGKNKEFEEILNTITGEGNDKLYEINENHDYIGLYKHGITASNIDTITIDSRFSAMQIYKEVVKFDNVVYSECAKRLLDRVESANIDFAWDSNNYEFLNVNKVNGTYNIGLCLHKKIDDLFTIDEKIKLFMDKRTELINNIVSKGNISWPILTDINECVKFIFTNIDLIKSIYCTTYISIGEESDPHYEIHERTLLEFYILPIVSILYVPEILDLLKTISISKLVSPYIYNTKTELLTVINDNKIYGSYYSVDYIEFLKLDDYNMLITTVDEKSKTSIIERNQAYFAKIINEYNSISKKYTEELVNIIFINHDLIQLAKRILGENIETNIKNNVLYLAQVDTKNIKYIMAINDGKKDDRKITLPMPLSENYFRNLLKSECIRNNIDNCINLDNEDCFINELKLYLAEYYQGQDRDSLDFLLQACNNTRINNAAYKYFKSINYNGLSRDAIAYYKDNRDEYNKTVLDEIKTAEFDNLSNYLNKVDYYGNSHYGNSPVNIFNTVIKKLITKLTYPLKDNIEINKKLYENLDEFLTKIRPTAWEIIKDIINCSTVTPNCNNVLSANFIKFENGRILLVDGTCQEYEKKLSEIKAELLNKNLNEVNRELSKDFYITACKSDKINEILTSIIRYYIYVQYVLLYENNNDISENNLYGLTNNSTEFKNLVKTQIGILYHNSDNTINFIKQLFTSPQAITIINVDTHILNTKLYSSIVSILQDKITNNFIVSGIDKNWQNILFTIKQINIINNPTITSNYNTYLKKSWSHDIMNIIVQSKITELDRYLDTINKVLHEFGMPILHNGSYEIALKRATDFNSTTIEFCKDSIFVSILDNSISLIKCFDINVFRCLKSINKSIKMNIKINNQYLQQIVNNIFTLESLIKNNIINSNFPYTALNSPLLDVSYKIPGYIDIHRQPKSTDGLSWFRNLLFIQCKMYILLLSASSEKSEDIDNFIIDIYEQLFSIYNTPPYKVHCIDEIIQLSNAFNVPKNDCSKECKKLMQKNNSYNLYERGLKFSYYTDETFVKNIKITNTPHGLVAHRYLC